MLNLGKLIQSCEEVIGWPYASPGTNDQNGIDCSGMFVRAYRAQGASIYHGSNRIIRVHCRDVIQVTSAAQLAPGMAVFKRREDGTESADYKPGGRYYDPALTGNFYHIGLVCSVNPLKIVHATTPVAKADTALGTWAWAGYLTDVDYGDTQQTGTTQPEGASAVGWGIVTTASGGLKMRETAGANGKYMLTIPQGSRIPVLRTALVGSDPWGQTQWSNHNGQHTGWVKLAFVLMEAQTGDPEPVPEGLGADYQQGYLDGYDAALGDAVRAVEGLGANG